MENKYISVSSSDYTNLSVVTVESEKELLLPVSRLRKMTFLLGILILVSTFLISYFIAKKLTRSIDRIKKDIGNLSIENLNIDFDRNYSDLDELNQLGYAFDKMCKRLRISIKETIDAKVHEKEANRLAFQSQMNPHFLYNTFAVMAAISGEQNVPEVEQMCIKISKMLRYLTYNSSFTVTLKEEMEYTKNYLEIFKKRYETRLVYSVNIEKELLSVKIPKLILQPLVENSILHGFDENTFKLEVSVEGKIRDKEIWIITVKDTGKGFTPEQLENIINGIEKFKSNIEFKDIMNKKVGLINTYARLYLHYRGKTIFDIKTTQGCTEILIGGPLIVQNNDS